MITQSARTYAAALSQMGHGLEWRPVDIGYNDHHRHTIASSEGHLLMLSMGEDGVHNARDERWHVRGMWSVLVEGKQVNLSHWRDHGAKNLSISIARGRGVVQLAVETDRRLLPAYREQWATCVERWQNTVAFERGQDELAAQIGDRTTWKGLEGGAGARHRFFITAHHRNVRADAEIYAPDGVNLKAYLPADLAIDVMAMIEQYAKRAIDNDNSAC